MQIKKTNVHRKKFQECPTNAQRSKLGFRTLHTHNGKVRMEKWMHKLAYSCCSLHIWSLRWSPGKLWLLCQRLVDVGFRRYFPKKSKSKVYLFRYWLDLPTIFLTSGLCTKKNFSLQLCLVGIVCTGTGNLYWKTFY